MPSKYYKPHLCAWYWVLGLGTTMKALVCSCPSQLTVQDFSSGQEREEEETQGLLLIEITQGFLEAWAWGPPSFIQGLKGLIFFSQSQKGLGPRLMLQLGVS